MLRKDKEQILHVSFFYRGGVGRGYGVGRGLGVTLGAGVADGVEVGVSVAVGVGVGPDCAQYLPPVLSGPFDVLDPPQTIISLPVHTAV